MPRQNRVTPFGEIVAVADRGSLMGNRGCLHDDTGRIRRPWRVGRWIVCVLEFKGRKRRVMTPGHYTELFFLDEATALAAGHRPCAECRRGRFEAFRKAAGRLLSAVEIDTELHAERLAPDGSRRLHAAELDELPDGVFIVLPGEGRIPLLVRGERLLQWSAGGYTGSTGRPRGVTVDVLTPELTAQALRAGYVPGLHPSADATTRGPNSPPRSYPMNINRRAFAPALVALALATTPTPAPAADPILFVTAFAPGDKGGIHAYEFDTKAGKLKPLARTAGVENPFFLALSPDRKLLYSIHAKQFGGKENEQVAAFQVVGRTGELKPLNRQSAEGTAACYLDVDRTGKTVLVANYSSGSVASLPVKADGSLGEPASFFQHKGSSVNPQRQKEPHAHCIVVSPDDKYAFAADLGTDQILCYKLDPVTAKLTPNRTPFAKAPPGAGPRHLTFHPDGKRVYVINELLNSVTVFDYDADAGTLAEKQTIPTLPADFKGTSHCADLKITPDGKFLYGTNRGHDSIAAYRIGDDGKLTLVAIEPSLGKGPQNLAITPDGAWLICANMPGNNISVFGIDPKTGRLKSAGEPVQQTGPSCIMLVP